MFGSALASRAFSYASKLKTAISDAATSFEEERKSYLQEKKEQDGGDFSETAEEVNFPQIAAVRNSSSAIREVIAHAIPIPTVLGQPSEDKIDSDRSEGAGKGKSSEEENLLPWAGVADEGELKAKILAISSHRENFLEDIPSEFVFDLNASYPTAMEMLKLDSKLQDMRFELVPKKIKDAQFWHAYFYHISQLKLQSGSNQKAIDGTFVPLPDSPLPTIVDSPTNPAPQTVPVPEVIPSPAPQRLPPVDLKKDEDLPTAKDLREAMPLPLSLTDPVNSSTLVYDGEDFVSDMYDNEWDKTSQGQDEEDY
ncbi:uncharacterized protein SPPG_08976 [Spizellomyces punctatus DAOM BR117]|uniref:BSD domain-containing protein n=1 Tax=Spizellomyces punctatus (strain DAOM BR117) TaxID=645134 RepID=A0A0L0HPI3_SPIPD|nr:uncharacterized protein SPPG_08976 [Spizellomyces punctatus DAOM BR117]KND02968.1 hypothetical protein SPPG_08976 [Spizellomyces punctatus DAOM BR117]|eukprot:XP_016611007.1 hypothetical protein SPPG_08976 [Spizellomyces punctatus DAOM BR117]